jgi:hypothetical protein
MGVVMWDRLGRSLLYLPPSRYPNIERKEDAVSGFAKLSQSICHCQYHNVWVPKYRVRTLVGAMREAAKSVESRQSVGLQVVKVLKYMCRGVICILGCGHSQGLGIGHHTAALYDWRTMG